jgi:hypothetical protein
MSDTLGDLSIGEISYVLKEFRMALIGAASDLTYEDDE